MQHENDEHFTHGNWTTPYRSPAGLAAVFEAQDSHFDLLLGRRRTYDLWTDYWPNSCPTPCHHTAPQATAIMSTD